MPICILLDESYHDYIRLNKCEDCGCCWRISVKIILYNLTILEELLDTCES